MSLNGVLVDGCRDSHGLSCRADMSRADPKPIDCGGTVMRVLGANRLGMLLEHFRPDDNVRLQDFLLAPHPGGGHGAGVRV